MNDKELFEEMSAALAIADEETRTRLIAEYLASSTTGINQLMLNMQLLLSQISQLTYQIQTLVTKANEAEQREQNERNRLGYPYSDFNNPPYYNTYNSGRASGAEKF